MNRAERLADRINLRGNERRVFLFLAERERATIEDVIDCLYGHRQDGGPLDANIAARVTICNVRKKVTDFANIRTMRYYSYEEKPRA